MRRLLPRALIPSALALPLALLALLACGSPAHAAQPGASDDVQLTMTLSGHARASQIGLPVYPGARERVDPGDDHGAATIAFSSGSMGFGLYLLKYQASGPSEPLAAYYLAALKTYGAVLVCDGQHRPTPATSPSATVQGLVCDDDEPRTGGLVFKAGTAEDQRMVSIQAHGADVHFDLLRLVKHLH